MITRSSGTPLAFRLKGSVHDELKHNDSWFIFGLKHLHTHGVDTNRTVHRHVYLRREARDVRLEMFRIVMQLFKKLDVTDGPDGAM